MPRPPKEKVKVLRVEKKIIKFKDKDGNEIEQEVEVKVYESKKVTEDHSLAEEILGNNQFESHDDKDY